MKRKQKRVTLLLASLLVGGFLVTGCTNSDYDFNEIDATMGFGGDGLELPASSTMDIPLKDVLDLEENGSVKLDDEGNYLFQLTGSGSSEANPKIALSVWRGDPIMPIFRYLCPLLLRRPDR